MIAVIAIGISASGTWWLFARSNENRHALGRRAANAHAFLNLNALQYVRVMIPAFLFLGCTGLALLIGYPLIVATPDDGPGGTLGYWAAICSPLVIAGGALQIAITVRTGRPRVLVLPPCREMSLREVERWLGLS
ncbi:hypothetical protein ACTHAM_001082 [Cellulomonas soli]|uniref:hypothetical protein n=1 Tax=Cellulomonas soli TaxID=931535 RepID=UPI003F83AEB0